MTFEEKYRSLNNRQKQVYHLIIMDKRQREVAEILGITVKTVKYHLTNIYKKFGVETKYQLIVASYEPLYPEPLFDEKGRPVLPLGKSITEESEEWDSQ